MRIFSPGGRVVFIALYMTMNLTMMNIEEGREILADFFWEFCGGAAWKLDRARSICFRCHPNFFGLIHITKHPKPHDPKRDGKNRVYFSQQIALVTSIFWKGAAGKGRARFARASSAFNFLESWESSSKVRGACTQYRKMRVSSLGGVKTKITTPIFFARLSF